MIFDRCARAAHEAIMAIEIEVTDNFGQSQVDRVLSASVIVRFDGPIETMRINENNAHQRAFETVMFRPTTKPRLRQIVSRLR
jgi:hypothetical protein